MELATVDAARVVEGVIGAALVLAVLAIAVMQVLRWRARQREDLEDAGVHALARFVDVTINDPTIFGGGVHSARVQRRRDTVAYGYLAVAEDYEGPGGERWCTLTVTLPGRVPFLVADSRAALGRVNVPMDAPHEGRLDDHDFDATYLVGAEETWLIPRILGPQVRGVLLASPVQRLMLRESSVVLRTFDGVELDDGMIGWLTGLAERFLSSTPSFITSMRAAAGIPTPPEHSDLPLPPGFYGPD